MNIEPHLIAALEHIQINHSRLSLIETTDGLISISHELAHPTTIELHMHTGSKISDYNASPTCEIRKISYQIIANHIHIHIDINQLAFIEVDDHEVDLSTLILTAMHTYAKCKQEMHPNHAPLHFMDQTPINNPHITTTQHHLRRYFIQQKQSRLEHNENINAPSKRACNHNPIKMELCTKRFVHLAPWALGKDHLSHPRIGSLFTVFDAIEIH